MPRYYFHFREGDKVERDNEGQELPNTEAAKREARFYASDLLREAALAGQKSNQTIEVTDAKGAVVLRFSCADVEEVRK